MDSQIWGPYFWFTLHTITLAYPEKPNYQDRRHYHDFFLSLQFILPCQLCRQHYQQHLRDYPVSVHLDSKESLVKWCFYLHNKVNLSLKKPEFTYEQFRDKYMRIYSPTIIQKVINQEHIKKYHKFKIMFLVLLLAIVFGIIYYRYRNRHATKYFFR
jgi:hypothetical protein